MTSYSQAKSQRVLWAARGVIGVVVLSGAFLITFPSTPLKAVPVYWHWKNPHPFKWKQFEVNIPKSMVVADITGTQTSFTIFEISDGSGLEDHRAIISLDSFPIRKKGTKEELEKFYLEKGFTLINTPPCQIKGFTCLRIQKPDKEDGISVVDEIIIFLDFDGVISFSGPESKHHLFLSVLESMQHQ